MKAASSLSSRLDMLLLTLRKSMDIKKIELFLPEGNPTGCIFCDVANWDGKVFKITKNRFRDYRERHDLQYTGIYILIGGDQNTQIYIGEAENLYMRLAQHLDEDFWSTCIAITKKENILNKAHVKFLENYFYSIAKEVGRCYIKNSCIPTKSSLSEADEVVLEDFAQKAISVIGALGYRMFMPLINAEEYHAEYFSISPTKTHPKVEAKGIISNEGFVVLKGSGSIDKFSKHSSASLRMKWESLRKDGTIKNNVFTKNYLSSSPSTAAAMILGRNANGLTEWKTKDKITLKEYLNLE